MIPERDITIQHATDLPGCGIASGDDVMTRKKHHGSTLDGFLAEEGILEEASVQAAKKDITIQ